VLKFYESLAGSGGVRYRRHLVSKAEILSECSRRTVVTMIKYDRSAVQKELDLRKHLRNRPPTQVAFAQGSKNLAPKGA
jgi:hypothetical protein